MNGYKKEEKWELRYEVPTAEGNWNEKVIYNKTKEKFEENKKKCKEYGYRIVSAKKLYPFNTYKNQHNFSLINDICFNRMHDMEMGEIEWDEEEYDRLESLKRRSEEYFCAGLPVAWVPWETWQDMKELSEMAILHRQEACIANGRPDLVTYC